MSEFNLQHHARETGKALELALKQNEDLTRQNQELMAQVEQLRKYGNLCAVNLSYSTDAFASEYKALWKKAAAATPAQCLAEVRAQAVMDFVGFAYSQFESGEYQVVARRKYHALNSRAQGQTVSIHNDAEYCGIIGNAEVYANQLRQQANGGE